MTLKEKIALCSGLDNWHTKPFKKYGIPSIMVSDGPHGLRKQPEKADMIGLNDSVPATCFPAAVISSCSWDKELLFEEGKAIAEEAKENGVSVILGPGTNIKRNPLCGRNFEYFSEDPILSGELSASFINGAQKSGVGTSLKHFACNSQEYFRMASDSLIDECTLREIYLKAFEIAVKKSQPYTIMCSYNKINGVYSSENRWLLTDILRGEWGFKGLVVTDWGAIGERDKSFFAGCDLSMPGGSSYGEKTVLKKIKKGQFEEKYVDESVERVLELIKKCKEGEVSPSNRRHGWRLDEPFPRGENRLVKQKSQDVIFATATHSTGETPVTPPGHHALAKKIACSSAVLLQNENALLPLSDFNDVCFIGDFAENPRYQGAGSSHINPTELHTIRELYPDVPFAKGFDKNGNTTAELLCEAENLAKKSKTAVIFAGLPPIYESESFDRENMKLPSGICELIEKIASVNENTAVVLYSGSAVECDFAEKVKSILYMGLPGQAGAEATFDLLLGKENPSGHLSETWPFKYEDCVSSSFYSGFRNAEYRENVFVGYRYYEAAEKKVRFPFGHGLSYTDFSLSDLEISENEITLNVKNTGKRKGSCVVQIYIEKLDSKIVRPKKELKAFEKVSLEVGETKKVSIELTEEMFSVWERGEWRIEGGDYKIYAGTSSFNPELSKIVSKSGEDFSSALESDDTKNRWTPKKSEVPLRSDLELLLNRKIEDFKIEKPFKKTDTFADARHSSSIIKLICKAFEFVMKKQNGDNTVEYKMAVTVFNEATFRCAQTAGGIGLNIAELMTDFANGKVLRGLLKLLRKS